MRTITVIAALFAMLLGTSGTWASPTFPEKVSDTTSAPCVPRCTLCHRDDSGGKGTVTKPFGVSMIRAGLGARDDDSVARALGVLDQQSTDSDGDGISDVDEIREGDSPNNPRPARICGPSYGCGARIEPGGRAGAAVFEWLAAAAILLALRFRFGSIRLALRFRFGSIRARPERAVHPEKHLE